MNVQLMIVVIVSLAVAAVCRRLQWSAPLVLVGVGLAASWIPGMPSFDLQPELVLYLVLPPLLYSAAIDSSYQAIRDSRFAIGVLAVGFPIFSMLVVGAVAYLLVPGLPLAAALVLGAVVAPPDAVSAQAIGRRIGLPRRIMTLLGGESLLNDATALTLLRMTLAAAIGTTTSIGRGAATFAIAAIGGVLVGLAAGYVLSWVRNRLTDAPMESAITFIAPFAVYYLAEQVKGSGVIAVVVVGLFLGHRDARDTYATRLQDNAVRRSVDVVLESFVFLLIGLQVRTLISGLGDSPVLRVMLEAAVILTTVILARFAWVYPTSYLSRLFRRSDAPTGRALFVVSWAGMRGVVSLAAAFAIPLTLRDGSPFPHRGEIVFLTFVVVVGTLLVQGTTLGWLAQRLGVVSDESAADRESFAAAQKKASDKAEEILDELDGSDAHLAERVPGLRRWLDAQRHTAWTALARDDDSVEGGQAEAADEIRTKILQAQRNVFIGERDAGRLNDEVLRLALRHLDLMEASADRDNYL